MGNRMAKTPETIMALNTETKHTEMMIMNAMTTFCFKECMKKRYKSEYNSLEECSLCCKNIFYELLIDLNQNKCQCTCHSTEEAPP